MATETALSLQIKKIEQTLGEKGCRRTTPTHTIPSSLQGKVSSEGEPSQLGHGPTLELLLEPANYRPCCPPPEEQIIVGKVSEFGQARGKLLSVTAKEP